MRTNMITTRWWTWYEDLGFKVVGLQSRAAYRRLLEKTLYGVGVTGRSTGADLP